MYDLPKLDRLLTAEDFAPWVGRMFTLASDPEPVAIQLIRITPRMASSLAHRAAFSLFFRSRPEVLLIDGLYAVRCGRFGPLDMHLTAVMSPPGERLYEAVFS